MKTKIISALTGLAFGMAIPDASAKLKVLTTITDLRALAAEVGGEYVDADSIAKGTQDPHYIEAKPSFMVKGSKADLVVSIGLDLEIGWLPSILQGSRNPRIKRGQPGFLEVGPLVQPLEVPVGTITRAQGDVHPSGNPHVTLDPIRAGEIAVVIGKRMGELDPAHAVDFSKNAEILQKRLSDRTQKWQERIKRSGTLQIVTFHRTLSYFLNRFGIDLAAILEPKPGIPPTSGHIIDVIKTIQQNKIPLVLVENYFDPTVTKKIQSDVPKIRTVTVAVAVEGASGLANLDDVYENLVRQIEGK